MKPIQLPYNQYDHYWIALWPAAGSFPQWLSNQLVALGFQQRSASVEYYVGHAGKQWEELWLKLLPHLGSVECEAAVVAGEAEPEESHLSFSRKPVAAITRISEQLWLGSAILENRLVIFKQSVVDASRNVVGYESFARVKGLQGEVINGGAIVEAAKTLGIEYALDRYLHVLAIKTYVKAGLKGHIFINFFPGFIQRPEVYMEGLSEAARMHGLPSSHVVLDFINSEEAQSTQHLPKVFEFCRSHGYGLALDDVRSAEVLQLALTIVTPDFVKLDRKLVNFCRRATDIDNLKRIIEVSHTSGAKVIAEGIETEEALATMQQYGVDWFQGYLFGQPSEAKV